MRNLFVVFTTIALLFLAGELVFNLVDIFGPEKQNELILDAHENVGNTKPDPVLNHVHIPGSKFIYRALDKKEFNSLVEYNSKGLNDYEYDYAKPENTVRILFLGDSFVEALQVKREDNFCKILEQNLNQAGFSKKYEVINAGVASYSSILHYIYLKNEGLKYEPDIVVLCFFMNDVYWDSIYKGMATFDEDGLPVSVHWRGHDKTKNLKGWKRFERELTNSFKKLINKSKFYVFLKKRAYRLLAKLKIRKESPEENPFFVLTNDAREDEPLLWDDTFRYISAIKKMAEGNGAEFLFITIPIEAQLSDNPEDAAYRFYFTERPDSARSEAKIEHFCREYSVDRVNLLYEFKNRGVKGLYFKNDGHFNAKGHREAADIILKRLFTVREFE